MEAVVTQEALTLSDWLIILSLGFAFYGMAKWGWTHYGPAPRQSTPAPSAPAERAGSRRRAPAFKARSPRSERSNAVNAGSGHQDARSAPVNVPANVQPERESAPPEPAPGAPDGAFTLSQRELIQLAEALHLRAEGATVEQAVSRAFGVSKGGSEGWKRAKALFDASTIVPGAAPDGTYTAPPPPPRKRRKPVAAR